MNEAKVGGRGGAVQSPETVHATRDAVIAELKKIELSSEPPDVMLDGYRRVLDKAVDLPPAAQCASPA